LGKGRVRKMWKNVREINIFERRIEKLRKSESEEEPGEM
jgi:hypothetical protein